MIRQTKEGWWIIDGDSHVSTWVTQSGRLDHDRSLLPLILPLIPEGGTVVDAGAYIGDHTWAYLQRVGPTGQVFAFEPQEEAFEALQLNCPGASCHNVALSDHYGCGVLVRDSERNYGACSVIEDPGQTEPVQEFEGVRLITLDSLCLPRLDFLKIDCEGAEVDILKGAVKTIERTRPVILVEVNLYALKKNGYSPAGLLFLIGSLGYSAENVYKNGPMDGPQWDALCKPI